MASLLKLFLFHDQNKHINISGDIISPLNKSNSFDIPNFLSKVDNIYLRQYKRGLNTIVSEV